MAKSFKEIFESFTSLMELLRNEHFQKLLVDYERAKRTFMVGYEVVDTVTSELLFAAEGKNDLKPVDYLKAFSEFVKRKENEISAIAILMHRPTGWNTHALNELKEKLRENQYDIQDLQKAHKIVYHKDAVDIISMIKHAARETEPLLSPEERVSQAIAKVTHGKELNEEQLKWMYYISEHLKQNMTLDEEDLKELPVFMDRGGLSRFKSIFADDYEKIIKEINLAIAA
ncbi:MAG: type I restriction-modification enzyme R subunit C-terminal domain-containing protein [Saprospiraceae bacterium]